MISPPPSANKNDLKLFSDVIPARHEEESLPFTLRHITTLFRTQNIPHEIFVCYDGSKA